MTNLLSIECTNVKHYLQLFMHVNFILGLTLSHHQPLFNQSSATYF